MRWTILVAGLTAGFAGPAAAHPHAFIDTTVEVVVDDQNRATGVWIGWDYDEFTTLSILADLGYDTDLDGQLTPEETKAIYGFDMRWQPGVEGDSYALLGRQALALSYPVEWTTDYAGNRLKTTHLRKFAAPIPLDGQMLTIRVYDPGYYTAYTLIGAKVTGGTGCRVETYVPDPAKADQTMLAALAAMPADVNAEDSFPQVGSYFAQEARVTCDAP